MTPRPRAGFTAEELVVVLGMIMFMAAGFLMVTRHVRESARLTTCASNQRQLALAARMYMADNTGHMPPPAQMTGALSVYVKNSQVFVCPTAAVQRRRDEEEAPRSDGLPARSDYLLDGAVQAVGGRRVLGIGGRHGHHRPGQQREQHDGQALAHLPLGLLAHGRGLVRLPQSRR